jgi:HK97 family phage major capsid protein
MLLEKFNQLKGAMALKLDEAEKFLAAGDMAAWKTAKAEYENLSGTAKAYQEQIEATRAQKALVVEPEVIEQPVPEPARLPFEPTEPKQEPAEQTVVKAVTHLRYGDTPETLDVIVRDIYGPGYVEKREAQKAAFGKYLRYGEGRLNAKEAGSLRELILTPDSVSYDVKSGMSVEEIRHNKAVQQESSLELGGALVPEDWRANLIKRMAGTTIVRRFANQITTTRDAVEWPKLEGGGELYTSAVRVTWVDEVPSAATVAATDFTVGTTRIPVDTVMARLDVSRNLLEDSAIDIPGLVSEQFSEAMALDEDTQFLVGNGSGRPYGILGVRDGAAFAPQTGIGYVASGEASVLSPDGLINLVYEPDTQYLAGAVLIGNKTAFRAIRQMKDGNSDYLWAKGIERGAPPTVLGYDYYMNQNMPSVAAGNYPIIFGDLRGFMIVDRVGMTVERIMDTDTVGKNKVAIFARRRLGGSVIYPWMIKTQKVAVS